MSKSKKRNKAVVHNKHVLSRLDELIRQVNMTNTLLAIQILSMKAQDNTYFEFLWQPTESKNQNTRWRIHLKNIYSKPPE